MKQRMGIVGVLFLLPLLTLFSACEPADQKAGQYHSDPKRTGVNQETTQQAENEDSGEREQGTKPEDDPASKGADIQHKARYSGEGGTGPGGTYESTDEEQ